ncbi:hypothetical protein [Longispora albida]|uniref:hypothetical protein n=1 Tax=Longispora albida TaxID=203523 RepID=UPI00036A922B|nr:hypothetical protein [Longispora albida]
MTLQRIARDVDAILDREREPQPESGKSEPLLTALAAAHARRELADAQMRELLAYARHFAAPHPYTLSELAEVCGMSVSGVRSAFDADDIAAVASATGLNPVSTERIQP